MAPLHPKAVCHYLGIRNTEDLQILSQSRNRNWVHVSGPHNEDTNMFRLKCLKLHLQLKIMAAG